MKPFNKATVEELEKAWTFFQMQYGSQYEKKTGFDFGALKEAPQNGMRVYTNDKFANGPYHVDWYDYDHENHHDWLEDGDLFATRTQCQDYCDYLNSRQ